MISRRDFMKTAGVATLAVAAASALTGCKSNDTPNPNPNPAPTPDDGNKGYTLGQDITVTDGVTVNITGKRYTWYDEGQKTGGAIILKVDVKNESDKAVAVKTTNFTLTQKDYVPQNQYPLNADADDIYDAYYLVGKFVEHIDLGMHPEKIDDFQFPVMDDPQLVGSYDLGTPGTDLAAYIVFLTTDKAVDGSATLTFTHEKMGGKVVQVKI